MTNLISDLQALDGQISDIESTLAGTQSVSAAFKAEMQSMQTTMTATGAQVSGLTRSLGTGLRQAFDGLVFDGANLSDVLKQLGRSMANAAFSQAFRPVQNALAGAVVGGVQNMVSGILPFADGAAFSQGKVTPFAKGGVVSRATKFPMRSGTGLMGEAGPEAIMPLTRGADGKLGVRSHVAARPVNVTMNIATPDTEGFRRSRTQIASQMSRAMARAQRNN